MDRKQMEQSPRLRYFAACNSEDGFHSFYRDIFLQDLDRVYIIKGGPGTGKSSWMRRVADAAEQKGYQVEEIYCSSDPTSLDGVIARSAENSFAVLDGTAPHVTEMELPGVRDEIWYVGDFWSSDCLREQKAEIQRDMKARSALYRQFYRYLKAAGQCERVMEAVLSDELDHERLQKAISRILCKYPEGNGFSAQTMLIASIGMSGLCHFDTMESHADAVFDVCDYGAMSHCLYEEILRQAESRRLRVWVSYDPLIPSHINGICFPDLRVSFVSLQGRAVREGITVHRLYMKRYVKAGLDERTCRMLANAQKCRARLMESALDIMCQIREIHFALESRYVASMDFDAMNRAVDTKIQEIFR